MISPNKLIGSLVFRTRNASGKKDRKRCNPLRRPALFFPHMRPSHPQYRRLDDDPGYNSQADDQVHADMEQAQLRLEQLRKEKEEVENSRRRLEAVSYTHLDVYKRQVMQSVSCHSAGRSPAGRTKCFLDEQPL